MEVRFLGTAASEAWPSLFCECEACKEARKAGGKNLRTRQQMLIDDDMLLDFGPDTLHHAISYGIELSKIKYVLVSHAHSDHFYPQDIMKRTANYAPELEDRDIWFFGNEKVVELGSSAEEMKAKWDGYENIHFTSLNAFEWREISEGIKVLPLPVHHDESQECFAFVIEKDGKHILYGCDSYIFPEESVNAIKGIKLDIAILECTGLYIDIGHGHCGIKEMLINRDELKKIGALSEDTPVYISHLCHSGAFKDGKVMLHDDIEKDLEKENVKVAYDGLLINV